MRWPLVAWETWTGALRWGRNYGLRESGFPSRPLPRARRAGRLTGATLEAGGARASGLRSAVRQAREASSRRRSDDDDAGVQAVDRIGNRRCSPPWRAARRWAGIGQPSPWQIGFQQSATPVMDNIVWFHDFLLWIIGAITAFVLVAAGLRDGALQRAGKSGPVAHHPQHPGRGAVDDRPDRDPGGDRRPLVQAAVPAAQHCRRPTSP